MIGYYVHHDGRGHLARARVVADTLATPVTGLSSLPRPDGWRGDWVLLPRDDDGAPRDPERGGAWHWAPRDHAGFGARMRAIADWIVRARPAALVSDVSVEVLALAGLLGVRTAGVLLHGRRDDPAHRLGHATADVLLAPWPAGHRRPWHDDLPTPLVTTGGFGRYDDRAPTPPPGDRRVLVLAGGGPHAIAPGDVAAAARATPGWTWDAAGLGTAGPAPVGWRGWRDETWDLLGAADVVVATAGNGVVSEIAAARRPAVLVPQERPFGEQAALAEGVALRCPVRVVAGWPAPAAWPGVLDDVAARDGAAWADHVDGGGADRFAGAVAELAA